MKINLIAESKSFKDNIEFQNILEKDPCRYCLFGTGLMCVERKYCRWYTHNEIFIKKSVELVKELKKQKC